jgi:hypothetical protein
MGRVLLAAGFAHLAGERPLKKYKKKTLLQQRY